MPPMLPLTRRLLLDRLGAAGGLGAALLGLRAMGAAMAAAPSPLPGLPAGHGGGRRIIVLGAGIAGMVAAFELRRAGYAVTVLEAQDQAGGRCRTLRAGDTVTEVSGATQRVAFAAGQHFNAGPARIPHHHANLLRYCRSFGIELEPFINDNRAALLQDDAAFGGAPRPLRQVQANLRGIVAEIAAKGLARGALDGAVTAGELERLRDLLRQFGALDRDLAWKGHVRGGGTAWPGAGDAEGDALPPLDLKEVLRAEFWAYNTQHAEEADQAATMLQVVGGVDRIARAFAERLGDVIVTGAEVARLRRIDGGARVEWRDRATGAARTAEAAAVVVTLPAPILAELDTDIAPEKRAALRDLVYMPAAKLAFQAPRFWEEQGIYGGISWTSRDSTQVWYPSSGFHQPRGILIGAYIWDEAPGRRFAALDPVRREAAVRSDLAALHPGVDRLLEAPVSVAWSEMPFLRGAWGEYTAEQRRTIYPAIHRPEPPYLFAGEHCSWLPGWMEGSVLSAHAAVAAIAASR
jgi:monoamine oxidase